MALIPTQERWRSRLPHWEVEGHWHFVTIRCKGSLPQVAKRQLEEIHQTMASVQPRSDLFENLQRRYFQTVEKYLHQAQGSCPLSSNSASEACLKAWEEMEEEDWHIGEATIMPNHIHFLTFRQGSAFSLKEVLRRFKGRSGRWINQALGRSGRFWQEDWFDRWMRTEAERDKTIAYIRNNSVKGKLVTDWEDHRWRISSKFPK